MIKLGVNIDHVATLRQARRERVPDPILAAWTVLKAGADSITAHLREDRRHIQDDDIRGLKKHLHAPLNMEMAINESVMKVALVVKPAWVCLVPENRAELTTEGGLDIEKNFIKVKTAVRRLKAKGIRVSLFVNANAGLMGLAKKIGADAVEIHTGDFGRAFLRKKGLSFQLKRIKKAAMAAAAEGLLVNAGHGLTHDNVRVLAGLFPFNEFNIGFSIVAESLFHGLSASVREMKKRMAR